MVAQILEKLLRERGMSVTELARQTGIKASTLHTMLNRGKRPDFNIMMRICAALGVPPETFCPDLQPLAEQPTVQEWELLRSWRDLDGYGRETTALVLQAESRRVREQSKPSTPDRQQTKIIPLYCTPAAAGMASPAFGEDYDNLTVDADCPADFAARIQGDSMAPWIEDGSVVLVVRQTNLRNGDVGLFFVDGDMKCKQYCQDSEGNVYLFSLNRARRDADVYLPSSSGVTICCFGQVLMERRPPLPVD